MKTFFFVKIVLISAVLYSIAASAQIVAPIPAYPHISVTPSSPRASTDSVTLFLALGSASNSCKVPADYSAMSFTIQESPLTIYPPVFNVTLSYIQAIRTPVICPDIYDPVDYGPTFRIGKLALGTYNVTDQNTKKQVGSFSVAIVAKTPVDTVYVTPGKPTVKDSLHFDLFNAGFSCCTQYFQKSVSVSDTVITLSFQYLDANNCECLVAGSHTALACGPQKAGKYAVYKAPGIYCPTPPCPLGLIRMVRVGEIVVSAPSGIAPAGNAQSPAGFSIRELNNAVRLDCSLSRPGQITAVVYTAAGIRVAQIYKGAVGEGPRGFTWTAAAPGAYFLSVELNGAPVLTRKIVISR